jgi:hypothetical protein
MTEKGSTAPRGEAAWKAAKQRIADRNEAAYARGRRERAARDAEAALRRRDADRLDAANRPHPGGR